ncbi:hypothetical protein [Dokdonella fugitiva]|jgi:hypothetical protein|uniref:Hemerythrin HHE cation binding domain-containing protein n=1 Tax=Dokdonella fugitiva TaxID=328517 RepID=A0A4R2I9C9_9GAMM|nr:hypothetical protein [Dokdonella fugitiva]MBA8883420.1 hypothetical protein [Dokdonella fugitiva]TCO40737.1 hypothetical protein EV148_10498 [Dokdonella fugitiva]
MAGKADAGEAHDVHAAFDWSAPWRHDPGLIEELRRANRGLMMSYSVALHAGRRGSFEAAALAISRCVRQLHEVQRTEALRLYPTIARRLADDVEGAATVTSLRREANALARHFMRLVEGLFSRGRPGMPPAALVDEARAVLQRYLDEKESRLYRFYALTAPADSDAA